MLKVEIVRKNIIKQPYKVNQEGNQAQESETLNGLIIDANKHWQYNTVQSIHGTI